MTAHPSIDLERRFKFHPANTASRRLAHEDVRLTLRLAAQDIVDLTPPGREQATALTKIEEAMFWANAAIARQPEEERQ